MIQYLQQQQQQQNKKNTIELKGGWKGNQSDFMNVWASLVAVAVAMAVGLKSNSAKLNLFSCVLAKPGKTRIRAHRARPGSDIVMN